MTFAQKLTELRKEKGMTQGEVAEQIGIARNSYFRYENGKARPRNPEMYEKLAEVFGCSVSELKEELNEAKAEKAPKKRTSKKKPGGKKAATVEEKKAAVEGKNAAVEEKDEIPAAKEDELKSSAEEPVVEIPKPETAEREDIINAGAEAISLASRLAVLLAGGELTRSEKDSIMVSLNGAYWRGR